MNKVEALQQPNPSASFTRLSILYNVVFVLNLVTTPFTAYLGEPFPNSFGSKRLPTWTSFDEFVNETTTYFKQFYNNQTMLHETSLRDVQSNAFVLRRDMTLPYEISPSDITDYMIRMPASLFFSYDTSATTNITISKQCSYLESLYTRNQNIPLVAHFMRYTKRTLTIRKLLCLAIVLPIVLSCATQVMELSIKWCGYLFCPAWIVDHKIQSTLFQDVQRIIPHLSACLAMILVPHLLQPPVMPYVFTWAA
ncbi:hypothetical protein Ae201684_016017 [Aphanomyces euteiches]|uniref:Uncharacterized protein n=1 Tax=Aphanomyces euteiches TaxID=100861 RepID=A0A6G0WE19_9STRA|nr:hypothetical protein Ae201684_016017 [Aphanomyces euteiches]KAH9141241.1 hypothetical protein AeRB84_014558 [Aphanomyces euteiches]